MRPAVPSELKPRLAQLIVERNRASASALGAVGSHVAGDHHGKGKQTTERGGGVRGTDLSRSRSRGRERSPAWMDKANTDVFGLRTNPNDTDRNSGLNL